MSTSWELTSQVVKPLPINLAKKPATIVFFQRKPRSHGNFSLEILFEGIRNQLGSAIFSKTAVCRFESKGFWKRAYNVLEAFLRQGEINHVTGDVHFLALLLKRRKTILTIHDCGFMNHPSALARWILQVFWLSLPVKKAAIITVISEFTKNELLRFVDCDPGKIKVIPNFISSSFIFSPKQFTTTKPVILQIGTAPNKNLERLVEALQGICCKLDIIGKLSELDLQMLDKYHIDYSNSYNLSEQELVEKYQACDLLAFASTYEGFGMPILEAQATGRPVITSNTSSMPEVAGKGACLVDPFDKGSIRQGILQILNDEEYRKELIIEGLENVKRFQLKKIASQYLELYQELYMRKSRSTPG